MEDEWCKVCNDFNRKRLTGWINMYQHRLAFDCTPEELLQSSSKCHYCGRIFDGIREFGDEIGDFVDSVSRLYARGPAVDPPFTLTLEIYFHDSRPKLELEFFAHGDHGLPAVKKAVRHTNHIFQPLHPTCEESLKWVRSHIDDCRKHTRCATRNETLLPTRALRISRSSEGIFEVKLQETRGLRERYVCLSHRWGGSETGTTRQETYAHRLNGIAWSTIPKTFQDAIEFVHALEIHYLWIDSYCIIQDNSADWDAESKLMASIFENSYLTIAATAAINNEAGCFWNKEGFQGRLLSDEDTMSPDLRHLSVRKSIHHWERQWTSNRETRFPLLTRAWVFQERLLAPRVLHFSHQELVWECSESGDCQCGEFDPRSNAKTISWTTNNAWHEAVELYTSLKLSRETDRLSAFHGFGEFYARVILANVERDCTAGRWKSSSHSDLLWRVESLANLKMGRSLCRCWDPYLDGHEELIIEEAFQRSCQYSYSAACSERCLKDRRLCRYGKESAAIGLEMNVEGISCVNGKQKKTSIQELLRCAKETPIIHKYECSTFPSWSWASARQIVKYWTDIGYSKRSDEDKSTCQFHADDLVGTDPPSPTDPGRDTNRLDSASSASPAQIENNLEKRMAIKASGYLVPAILQYRDVPIPAPIEKQHTSGKGVASVTTSHDILKYGLRVHSHTIDLDFHPDWILSLDAPRFIPNRTSLFLLHIISNVYLVLKEEWFFTVPSRLRAFVCRGRAEDLKRKINAQKQLITPDKGAGVAKKNNEIDADHAQKTTEGPQRELRKEQKEPRKGNTTLSSGTVHASGSRQLTSRKRDHGAEGEKNKGDVQKNEVEHYEPVKDPLSEPSDSELYTERETAIQKEIREYHIQTPSSPEYVAFRRIGILRIPWRQADSLHNESHWIDKVEIG